MGPELIRFGDEDEPRVISLTHPDGPYHSFEGWRSPSGNGNAPKITNNTIVNNHMGIHVDAWVPTSEQHVREQHYRRR